jgi:hypothetical protein
LFGSNHISATSSFHSGSANGLLFTLFLNFQSFQFWQSGSSGLGSCRISPPSSLFISSPVVFFLFGGAEVYTGDFERTKRQGTFAFFFYLFFFRASILSESTHTPPPKRSVCVTYYFCSFLFSSFFIASQPATLHRHLFFSFLLPIIDAFSLYLLVLFLPL